MTVFICDGPHTHRDFQKVLKEDRERLHRMHKSQPCFTEHQKEELAEVHPWMKKGGLPQAINVKVSSLSEDHKISLGFLSNMRV